MRIEKITEVEKQYVIFYLADKKFGVNINQTKEILSDTELTFVPDSPDYISGIINLRGSVVPVVDLKLRLDIRGQKQEAKDKIIIIELKNLTAGMQVDDVKEIEALKKENIENLPQLAKNIDSSYIEGVGKMDDSDQLLLLLNLKNILSSKEISELENIKKED